MARFAKTKVRTRRSIVCCSITLNAAYVSTSQLCITSFLVTCRPVDMLVPNNTRHHVTGFLSFACPTAKHSGRKLRETGNLRHHSSEILFPADFSNAALPEARNLIMGWRQINSPQATDCGNSYKRASGVELHQTYTCDSTMHEHMLDKNHRR